MNSINNDEIKIKIAEALGTPKHARFWALDHAGMRWWAYKSREVAMQMHELFGTKSNPVEEFWDAKYLPNYPEDLNAMHEAEKMLIEKCKESDYWFHLREILEFPDAESDWSHNYYVSAIHATAAQRAEAFLRTLNLWEP